MKKVSLFSFILSFFSLYVSAQEEIDLSGLWAFQIDRDDKGEVEAWYNRTLNSDEINLPASMAEKLKGDLVTLETQWTGSLYDSSYYYSPAMEKYRREGDLKFPFFLTPDRHYIGAAWYQKQLDIPDSWTKRRTLLYLERPHIETTVWIEGKKVGRNYSLSTAHVYDLTSYLKKGKQRLTIRIDNRIKKEYDVGQDSHSVTDQTQGNWNGIVGKMALISSPLSNIEDIQVFPCLKEKKAAVKLTLLSGKRDGKALITLSAESFNTPVSHRIAPMQFTVKLSKGENKIELDLPMGDEMQTWDEFSPALYRLTVRLNTGKENDLKIVEYGMREIGIEGKGIYVNGRRTLMRGTVENCDFPLTGYAPMDVDSWLRIFNICKQYGLNHMRFHSFCPPEAAFIAADRLGFYLQPEGPSWPNHGSALGKGWPIDTYLLEETKAMTRCYGNHPSFCMLACGNEPAGNWVEWVSDFVDYWKATDTRRIYTGASVGGGWAWQPKNQYHVKAGARGLNWHRQRPESRSDFRAEISKAKNEPWISHETGQWCVFPDFDEICKYTGVNKAKNFEIFRDLLDEHNMSDMAGRFTQSSGKLQAICYKHEIEKTLRTPDYAGFQLLALNDYSGQGTALVGLLNVFFEEKGYIDAAQFRRFCNSTVPLARMEKFVYKNNDTLKADIEVSHFGKRPLKQVLTTYRITDKNGQIWRQGELSRKEEIPLGNCLVLGSIATSLSSVTKAEKMNLQITVSSAGEEPPYINDWDFWVYPADISIEEGEVYITDSLDEKAQRILDEGGKVLIAAAGKISYGSNVQQYFTPVFWNTSWFKMRPPHTTGIYVNAYHPLFREFPTDDHSDLQWWELLNRAQTMQFTRFPAEFRPLVQSIDTWFLSRKIGVLFEANVLKGKLMMTSMDISSRLSERFVACRMRKAILDYMNSDNFRPACDVTLQQIGELFTRPSDKVDSYTKSSPDELKPKITTKP